MFNLPNVRSCPHAEDRETVRDPEPGGSIDAETADYWSTITVDDGTKTYALVLEAVDGHTPPLRLVLGQSLTVGRDKSATWCVPTDEKMSRIHFALEYSPTQKVLRDMNSKNGTFLNGISVSKAHVADGDQIIAGRTVFVVRILTV